MGGVLPFSGGKFYNLKLIVIIRGMCVCLREGGEAVGEGERGNYKAGKL